MAIQSGGSLLAALYPASFELEGSYVVGERQGHPSVSSLNKEVSRPLLSWAWAPREGSVLRSARGILAWKFSISRPRVAAPSSGWMAANVTEGTEDNAGIFVIVGCLSLSLLIEFTIAMSHLYSLIL